MTTMLDGRFCTFMLDDLYFGVPVTQVQEVIRSSERTRVPLVPTVVNGLMNLRGEIVTTINLRRRLGLPDRPEAAAMNVVVRTDDGVVSILVDEIRDVIEVGHVELESVPPTLAGACRDLVSGIYKLDHSLLLVLDIFRLLDMSTPTDVPEAQPTA